MPGGSGDLALGDLNGDGAVDLVSGSNVGLFGYINVQLGAGNGTFGAAVSYTDGTAFMDAVVIGDVNGDGRGDIVSVGTTYGDYDGLLTVWLGQQSGGYTETSTIYSSGDGRDVEFTDLNGDNVPDLLLASDNGVVGRLADTATTTQTSESRYGVPPLLEFSLRSQAEARGALQGFSSNLEELSGLRGRIGASMSRITAAVNLLGVSGQYCAEAASRIKDADVAQEAGELVRQQILQQAGAAVLAQAEQHPALALSLLAG